MPRAARLFDGHRRRVRRAALLRGLLAALLAAAARATGAAAAELTPQEVSRNADLVVMRVSYEGAFKTWPSRLALVTRLRPGMRLGEIDPLEIAQRLWKTGLYREVGIEYEPEAGGVAIVVRLREKWTVIPLPYGQISKDRVSAGLFFLDSDFLGSRASVVAGGAWTAGGWTATAGWIEPSIAEGRIGLSLFASAGAAKREAAYQDGSGYGSFGQYLGSASGSLTFRRDRELRPFFRTSLRYVRPDRDEAAALGLQRRAFAAAPELGLAWERTRRSAWIETGARASSSIELGADLLGAGGYRAWTGRFSAASSGEGVLIGIGGSAEYGDRPFLLQRSLSGPGFRVLPRNSSYSARYGAAHASIEAAIFRPEWATLTLAAFAEGGAYAVGPERSQRDEGFYGAGVGFRAYLRDLAVPAMGADFAINARTGLPAFSLYVGFQAGQ